MSDLGHSWLPCPSHRGSSCRLMLPLHKPILDSYITALISLAGGRKKKKKTTLKKQASMLTLKLKGNN